MTTPEELRGSARLARVDAAELRTQAARLDRSHLHEIGRLAGDSTWLGPTAAALQRAIERSRCQLQAATDALRRDAMNLDAEASDLDRAAAQAQTLSLVALPPITRLG
jgi:hypothetical protein